MAGQSSEFFLPLTEYSSKYKVSISTLRRRIKANDIRYRFDQGKYMILDSENPQRPSLDSVNSVPRPSLKSETQAVKAASMFSHKSSDEALANLSGHSSLGQKAFASLQMPQQMSVQMPTKTEEPVLTAANRLLTELKKAYTQILQEKEEQVLHLKEEVSDLKTLVRVLESENERLKRY